MSCLTVNIKIISNGISASLYRIGGAILKASRITPPLNVRVLDKTNRLSARCSVVCSIGTDSRNREIFMVREGVFLLFDGQTFNVLKNGV